MTRLIREPLGRPGHRGRPSAFAVGDYLCSEHDLYRVEQVAEGRALLEDCRTGGLVDAPLEDVASLRPVRRATG